jgi:hypothetical protein
MRVPETGRGSPICRVAPRREAVRRIAGMAAMLLLPGTAACGLFGGACGESRVINLYAVPDGSDINSVDQQTALSTIGMLLNRGRAVTGGFERTFQWQILSDGLAGTVTAVGLYQGSAATGGGTLLYAFPLDGANPDQHVASSGMETDHQEAIGAWYVGTVSFEDLMLILYQSPTYLEIRTTQLPSDPRVWHKYYCD